MDPVTIYGYVTSTFKRTKIFLYVKKTINWEWLTDIVPGTRDQKRTN